MSSTVRNYIPRLNTNKSGIGFATGGDGASVSSATPTPFCTPSITTKRISPISVPSLLSTFLDDKLAMDSGRVLPGAIPMPWLHACETEPFMSAVKSEDHFEESVIDDGTPNQFRASIKSEQNTALDPSKSVYAILESEEKSNMCSTVGTSERSLFTKCVYHGHAVSLDDVCHTNGVGLVDLKLGSLSEIPGTKEASNTINVLALTSNKGHLFSGSPSLPNFSLPIREPLKILSEQHKQEATLTSTKAIEDVSDANYTNRSGENPSRSAQRRATARNGRKSVRKGISKREAAKAATVAAKALKDEIAFLANTKQITDEELLQLKPKKKRRSAKFENPIPSRFCHVCSRTPKNIRIAVCSQIREGTCRKVVCEKCFLDYQFGTFDHALNLRTSNWICPHCLEECPPRAQCSTYGRINDRLRVNRLKQERPSRSPEPGEKSEEIGYMALELVPTSSIPLEDKYNDDEASGMILKGFGNVAVKRHDEIGKRENIVHDDGLMGVGYDIDPEPGNEMKFFECRLMASQLPSLGTGYSGENSYQFTSPVSVIQSDPARNCLQDIRVEMIEDVDMVGLPEVGSQGSELEWPGVSDVSPASIDFPGDTMEISSQRLNELQTNESHHPDEKMLASKGIQENLGMWGDLTVGITRRRDLPGEKTGDGPSSLPKGSTVILSQSGNGLQSGRLMETFARNLLKRPESSSEHSNDELYGMINAKKGCDEVTATLGNRGNPKVDHPLYFEIDGLVGDCEADCEVNGADALEEIGLEIKNDFQSLFD